MIFLEIEVPDILDIFVGVMRCSKFANIPMSSHVTSKSSQGSVAELLM
jgi:hypothetical protein